MSIFTIITLSLLMGACIGADMHEHKFRRRKLWILGGLLLGPIGVGIYLIWDRWKK